MPFPDIQFEIDPILLNLDEALSQSFRETADDWALDLADELQQQSYRGATLDLAAGWDVIPATTEPTIADLQVSVVNNTEASFHRVVGRGPGRRPPIEPLRRWAVIKGVNPYALAIKIAREGTERWKQEENFIGFTRNGQLKPDSFIFDRVERLAGQLNEISF